MGKIKISQFILHLIVIAFCLNHVPLVSAQNWQTYWNQYSSLYENSTVPEATRRVYYNYNMKLINIHNALHASNLRTYSLAANQFTAMRRIQVNALFPEAVYPTVINDAVPPSVQTAGTSFDPFVDLEITADVDDQGIACSSSWAYATAAAIRLHLAQTTGPTEKLSAQNLIDCAGSGTACTTQAPHTAFEYLTHYNQYLYRESDYNNTNTLTEQGMCVPPSPTPTTAAVVTEYSVIADGNDDIMKQYVFAGYPVIIELKPSFEFIHYSSGVFQQPAVVRTGSHFLTVVGYGTDTNEGLDYWLCQNSFGPTWGENGFIRIARTETLTKNAVFPSSAQMNI